MFTFQIYRAIDPLEGKLDFFSPLGFEAKCDFDHKTYKLKPHLTELKNDTCMIIQFVVKKQHQFFNFAQRVLNQT